MLRVIAGSGPTCANRSTQADALTFVRYNRITRRFPLPGEWHWCESDHCHDQIHCRSVYRQLCHAFRGPALIIGRAQH
jgi:hypothetical protein